MSVTFGVTASSGLRARFYDPTTGQFLSRDPANAATRSAYGYVYGNPLNNTDPSGLYCLSGVDKEASDREGHQVCNGAAQVADNLVPDDLRAPDYVTVDLTAFSPLVGPFGPGIGLDLTVSRSGRVFVGPQGGVGAGGGLGVRPGWLDKKPTCDADVDAFLSGGNVSFQFQVGPAGAKTISNNGATSTEAGLGGSLAGGGLIVFAWNPFSLPFSW